MSASDTNTDRANTMVERKSERARATHALKLIIEKDLGVDVDAAKLDAMLMKRFITLSDLAHAWHNNI